MLSQVYRYAVDASDHAALLKTYGPSQGWQLYSVDLRAIRDDVNAIGPVACKLAQLRDAVTRTQASEIDAVEPLVSYMGLHTTEALRYLNTNQSDLWAPAFRSWINALSKDTSQMAGTLKEYRQLAKVHQKDTHLAQVLGVNGE
jgi:hypothetical protein